MFSELAVGIGIIIVAAFAGISLLVRTLPPKPNKKGLLQPADALDDIHRRLEEVDELRRRLVDVEERLDLRSDSWRGSATRTRSRQRKDNAP